MTILARLRHYVATHPCNWDLFLQPLTYVYNTQVQRSTNTIPSCLFFKRHPSRPTRFDSPSALPVKAFYAIDPPALRAQLLGRIKVLRTCVCVFKCHESAQERYKQDFKKKVCSTPMFKPEQMVYIEKHPLAAFSTGSRERLATNSYKKLISMILGPFASLVTKQTR